MAKRTEQTIKRYVDLYITFRVRDINLSEIKDWNLSDFEKHTQLKGIGQFKLSKSLAHNIDVQKDVNNYIEKKDIESKILKPIKVKDYYTIEKEIEKEVIEVQEYYTNDYIKPDKKSLYGIAEINTELDVYGQYTFWIKYTSYDDFIRQLNTIKAKYKCNYIEITYHSLKMYQSFIDKEFEKELDKAKVL